MTEKITLDKEELEKWLIDVGITLTELVESDCVVTLESRGIFQQIRGEDSLVVTQYSNPPALTYGEMVQIQRALYKWSNESNPLRGLNEKDTTSARNKIAKALKEEERTESG